MKSVLRVVVTCVRTISSRWLAAGLAVGLLAAPSSVHAQALSGLAGTVYDQGGGVVDAAQVTATNDATGVARRTATSGTGSYSFTDLIPGSYTVKFEKAGFQGTVHKGVNVEVSRTITVDAALVTGTVEETVEVIAPQIAMETRQPEIGYTVEKRVLEAVPIEFGGAVGERGRQIDSLLTLVPGVTGDSFSHRINGGVDMQNEIVFNGIPAAQAETQGYQSNINPPFEMVEEVRVLSSVFSAQYGLGQGVVSYRFASGTNKFHGDVFEILHDTSLNAVGHTPVEAGKADRDKRHNYGFTLSGPVMVPGLYDGKDKTFFHFSGDWYRQNSALNQRFSVPTDAMKRGDFSQYPNPIFVPVSGLRAGCNPGAAPGQQFPGNIIPSSCISDTSKTLLGFIPSPEFSGLERNAASKLTNLPTRQTNWGFSLDHYLTSTQSVHFSFWRDSWLAPFLDNGPAIENPLGGLKEEPRLGKGIFASYSNTFNDHLAMTFGFGYMREQNNQFNKQLGNPFVGFVNSQATPGILFDGPFSPSSWGAGGGGLTFSLNNKLGLSFANNWLYAKDRHTFNFGVEVRKLSQIDHECQNCTGNAVFSSRTTGNPADFDHSGSAFASFLLGNVDSVSRQYAIANDLSNLYIAPYIQDDFKISSKLTLNLGLRWDLMRPFREKNDLVVFFDPLRPDSAAINPATGKPILGGFTKLGSCDGCAGFRNAGTKWNQLSPRAGAVYRVSDKTTLMAGLAVNHLTGGAFEFGTNKVAVNYSGLLTGTFNAPGNGNERPGYGQWDANPIPDPTAEPFSPTLGHGQNVNAFSQSDGRAPWNLAWNVGFQRELPGQMLFTGAYVGNLSRHLPSALNYLNAVDPKFLDLCTSPDSCVLADRWTSPQAQAVLKGLGYGQCDGYYTPYCGFINDKGAGAQLIQAVRPFPQYFGATDNFETNGRALYNAVQVTTQKRLTSGVSFLVAYTLSKSMSDVDSGFSSFNGAALNKNDLSKEYTVSNNDHTHQIQFSGVYELPFGKESKNGFVKNVLGGWKASGFLLYVSGGPFGVGANGSPLRTGNRANYDPNVPINLDWSRAKQPAGDVRFSAPLATDATPFDVFNINAFSSPGDFRIGNSPRNVAALRGPWFTLENFGLTKTIKVGRTETELRLEFFNLLNRVGTCGVNNNVDDPDHFGLSNGNRIRDGQGRVIGVHFDECQGYSPRRGQVFVKVKF